VYSNNNNVEPWEKLFVIPDIKSLSAGLVRNAAAQVDDILAYNCMGM
jgi:hypothetical protein